jgi:hypothetical protein
MPLQEQCVTERSWRDQQFEMTAPSNSNLVSLKNSLRTRKWKRRLIKPASSRSFLMMDCYESLVFSIS